MAIAQSPERHRFLGLDKVDTYLQSRRNGINYQPQLRPNQSPQPPGGGWRPGRRDFSIIAGGVIATAIMRPWEWFDSIYFYLPEETPLDQGILAQAEKEVFNLNAYSLNSRRNFLNFWKEGESHAIRHFTATGDSAYITFQPAQAKEEMDFWSLTQTEIERRNFSDGSSSLLISVSGSYLEGIGQEFSPEVQRKIVDINFEHEALVTIALINGITSVGRSLGLDFTPETPKKSQEDALLSKLQTYQGNIFAMAEAIAELNDYLLLEKMRDRDSQGRVIWVKNNPSSIPVPVLEGAILNDAGLHYMIDSTMGPSLEDVSDFEALAKKYKGLQDISGHRDYYQKVKNFYKNVKT